MKRSLGPMALTLLALAAPAVHAEELTPLSVHDKARLEQLLQGFDSATYEYRFQWVDSRGRVQSGRLGRAVGLGSVQQGATIKAQPGQLAPVPMAQAARPAYASLRARGLGPNQTITGFKSPGPAKIPLLGDAPNRKLDELDALLRKYTR